MSAFQVLELFEHSIEKRLCTEVQKLRKDMWVIWRTVLIQNAWWLRLSYRNFSNAVQHRELEDFLWFLQPMWRIGCRCAQWWLRLIEEKQPRRLRGSALNLLLVSFSFFWWHMQQAFKIRLYRHSELACWIALRWCIAPSPESVVLDWIIWASYTIMPNFCILCHIIYSTSLFIRSM